MRCFNTFYTALGDNTAKNWLSCITFGTLFAGTFSKQSYFDIEKEINEKVIDMKVNGISSMKTGETYIVFATYNKKLKKYNPVGLYQGIFEEEYDDKYIRNLSDSDVASAGEKVVYELEQDDIDNCIQE